ncbi:MAG TPA: alpha-amylase family glycosyl hydrolase [Chthoniobacterales bacterium]|nr:alpha-amylase family glycosyl hydrolase [Chthoniobacterales bacterium]
MGLRTTVILLAAVVFLLRPVCAQVTEAGGVAAFEAENFVANNSPRTPVGSIAHSWTLGNATTGYSGSGYMEATPNVGPPGGNADNNSPELQFTVNFTSTGTHYIWMRGYAPTSSDDSMWVGIDGANSVACTLNQYNVWQWSNAPQGSSNAPTIPVATTGNHTVSLWMREDGLKIDEVILTTDSTFSPTVGNVWHIPINAEPAGVTSMRSPFTVNAGNDVTIWSGNQYQGGGGQGNQLTTGSTVFYKKSTDATWQSVAMSFNSATGNNKYYNATIPGATFAAGDTIQYYLKIPYSDHLPTFVYGTDTQSNGTEIESIAQAAPFTFVVQDFAYWQSQNIYQIITDRFFDGDPSNNNADGTYDPAAGSSVHGGDFKGIQQKLDYIKSLGATAIWISPVVKNTAGQYHGYSGWDFYNVDPHWGTLTDLQNLVNAAHARGIQVIDDIVLNHGGDLIYSTDSGYPNFLYPPAGYHMSFRGSQQYPPPFDLNATNPTIESLFHNNGYVQNFNDATQVVDGELRGLDDLKTETSYVRTSFAAIYKYWIDNAGFDAFRIDTTKHVDHGCWQYWCPQLHAEAVSLGKPNFFMFGEVEDGADADCGAYTGIKDGGDYEQDSLVDYPLYFMVNGVFAQANSNTQQIESHYNAIPTYYDTPAQMRLVTFLDNHDHPRFLNSSNANNNVARLNVALAFLYTARGIPCLYYGTEQGFNGGSDPNNREDMFAGGWEPDAASVGDNFNMTHPIFQYVAKLNNFRRLYPAMSLGTHVNQWNNPNGPGLFAYARRLGSQEVFVVFNTAGSAQTLPARSTIYPAGTTLINLLNPSESITTIAGPQIPSVGVPGTTAKIFIAQSMLQSLDPVITAITPAHDAGNVNTSVPVVITFSDAMDAASVQAAFRTTPATSGTFAWSSDSKVLTYTPNDPGWPGLTLITIDIAPTAKSATSGKTFYAGFEARFTTAASSFADTIPPTSAINSPNDGSTLQGQATISGNASDNIAVQSVEVQIDGSDWTPATGTTSWSFNFNSANFLNGSHIINERAIDTSGNISDVNTINVRFSNVPGDYVQRISCGNSSSVIDCSANTWLPDQSYSLGSFGFTAGSPAFVGNSIAGACPAEQPLYQNERSSTSDTTVHYLFDCPEGIYNVTLLEAETTATGPNQRVFNVSIEGQNVLSNFDIYAAAGGANIAWSQTLTNITVADSQLDIQFTPLVGNSRISGIAVEKVGNVFSDTDGIPDWWRLAYFDHAVGEDGDGSRGSDDPDGDGLTNLQEYLAGTNPLDPSSRFAIINIAIVGNDVQITWSSVSGKSYQLQRADSPDSGADWQNVGSNLIGNGPSLMQTDSGAAHDPVHFYRAVVQ